MSRLIYREALNLRMQLSHFFNLYILESIIAQVTMYTNGTSFILYYHAKLLTFGGQNNILFHILENM